MGWAKSQVRMDIAWSGTIQALNQILMPPSIGLLTFKSASLSGPGGSISLEGLGMRLQKRSGNIYAAYMYFRLTIQAWGSSMPPPSLTKYIWLYLGEIELPPPPVEPPPIPPDDIVVDGPNLTYSISVQVTNVDLWFKTTEAALTKRGFLWFGDRNASEGWGIGEGSTTTVTATGPGGPFQVQGNLNPVEPTGDLGIGWAVTGGLSCYRAPEEVVGLPLARVSAVNFNGIAVDFSQCELYNPGANAPDPYNSAWGRTSTQTNCWCIRPSTDGAEMYRRGNSTGSEAVWGFTIWQPIHAKFINRTGNFGDDATRDDIVVWGSPIEWYQEGGVWKSRPKKWAGDLEVIQQYRSWLFHYEWQTLSSQTVFVNVDTEWREANNEDVGGTSNGDPQNDIPCPLILHPLNVTNLEGDPTAEWGSWITVAHSEPIAFFDKDDSDRPAAWTGSNGLTPGEYPDDYIWQVAARSNNPTATLTTVSRKWLELDRLQEKLNDPERQHNHDWVIQNYPNLPIAQSQDDPEWHEQIPVENEWHWQNQTWLEIDLNAPRDATIQVVVTYSEIYVYDPWYTCFEHTFGAEGEWEYSRTQKQVVYTATVEKTPAGQEFTPVLIDLCSPVSGERPPRLWHVDKVDIVIIGESPAEDETWTLHSIWLTGMYWKDEWGPDPPTFFSVREYDPYDWLSDYTGFASITDGKPCFDIVYGYEEHESVERSLKQRQKYRHCPESEAEGILDYAKPLARLLDEINWQRGWEAGWTNGDPHLGPKNRDAEGNTFVSTFRWWDLLRSHEYKFLQYAELKGAPIVRGWYLAAGIKHTIYYEKWPQGRIHGMAYTGNSRARNMGTVRLYRRPAEGGDWALIDTTTTDEHGRFRFDPVQEKGWIYRVSTGGSMLYAKNARYSWSLGALEAGAGVLACNMFGNIYRFESQGNSVIFYWAQGLGGPWHGPYTLATFDQSVAKVAATELSGSIQVVVVLSDNTTKLVRCTKLGAGKILG